jgi:hypothetical protein
MGPRLALAIVVLLGSLSAAEAQQANGSTNGSQSFGGMGSSTPGGESRQSVGTYATPGAERQSTLPGGGISMGAGTQDSSKLTDDPSNFDSSRGSKSR